MAAKVGQVVVDFLLNTAKFETDLKKATKSFKSIGREFTAAGKALTEGVTLPLAAVGAVAIKIGNDFDEAMDTIRAGTGATGAALKGLGDSLEKVLGNVPNTVGEVGTAIADLNTRLGLTGKPLEDLTTQMLNLARITKTDVATLIASTTRVFGDWSVATADQSAALDYLYKVSQSTGIGIGQLSDTVVQFGAPMRALGYSLEESAALMGRFEKEGVNMETVMSGLRYALGQFAKAGMEPAMAFKQVQAAILGAKNETEATGIAFKVFGQRAAVDMSRAILEGRFSIDQFVASLKDGKDTINAAAADTMSFGEKMALLGNKIALAAKPLGDALLAALDKLMPTLEAIIGWISGLVKWFADLPAPIQNAIIVISALAAALGPLLLVIGATATGIASLLPLLGSVAAVFGPAAAGAAGFVLALNPVVLAVGAAAAAVLFFSDDIAKATGELLRFIGVADQLPGVVGASTEQFKRIAADLQISIDTLKAFTEANKNALPVLGQHKAEIAKLQEQLKSGKISQQEYEKALEAIIKSTKATEVPNKKLTDGLKNIAAGTFKTGEEVKKAQKEFEKITDSVKKLELEYTHLPSKLDAVKQSHWDLKAALADFDRQIKQNTKDLEAFGTTARGIPAEFRPMQDIPGMLEPVNTGLGDLVDSTKQTSEAAKDMASVWKNQVSTIVTDFSAGVADIIFEGASFKDTMIGIFKEFGKGIVRGIIEDLLSPLMENLSNFVTKAVGHVGGMVSTAGSAMGSIASTAIGLFGGIISAVGGMLGGLIGGSLVRRDTKEIEVNTRYTQLYCKSLNDKADEIRSTLWTFYPWMETFNGILDSSEVWLSKIHQAILDLGPIPAYAGGISYVPQSGLAYLHRGESVVNNQSSTYRGGDVYVNLSVTGGDDLVQTVKTKVIPILKREMVGGNTGLRESVCAAYDRTSRAY